MSTNEHSGDNRYLSVVPGEAHGPVVFSDVPLSFMMGVDPKTGVVVDTHHPLLGRSLKDCVLAIPCGRGSCSGSGAILELILTGNAPSALIFREPEMILTLGVMVAEAMFGRQLPVVFLNDAESFEELRHTTSLVVHEHALVLGPSQKEIPLRPSSLKTVQLTEADREVISGKGGEASRIALEIIVAFAALQGAGRLIDVTQVHIDACAYSGSSSLLTARQRFRELGAPSEALVTGDKIGETYLRLGAKMSFTCAPYLLDSRPGAGEQIGWSESNAVVFANSVLGARTQKYPDYLDVFIALTGRAPYVGCHTAKGRRPTVIIAVPQLRQHDASLFPLLGYHIGDLVGSKIPFIVGLESASPSTSDLKAFGAGFATTSSAPMFHMRGVTPEAAAMETGISQLPRIEVKLQGLQQTWTQLNTAPEPFVDMVTLGNPHFSVDEFAQLAQLCRNRQRSEDVGFAITTSRAVYQQALELGYLDVLEAFGARFITDACWCMIEQPAVPAGVRHVMTNSAKYAHYGP
ncbi:Uncharacterized protein CTRI78_v008026 [Colletotrichum trifolii]|uniref:DUF521 domain-containing protein n=1 Tax=Colletotrichum trifolii TaxID=5466 RepID=A0A4R8R4W6_COLTR|nr:Uncharacterized protein CTRI78_v008026 [Colletotrichum trifolii]